ncbi:hypothetical protein VTN31DRAFT_7342 [Thermomyces dupontii]|uniref:uncharacterized protein n=1 Tax=Talaromyces thermophilus TaxID=28565 RepID=UPI00374202B6
MAERRCNRVGSSTEDTQTPSRQQVSGRPRSSELITDSHDSSEDREPLQTRGQERRPASASSRRPVTDSRSSAGQHLSDEERGDFTTSPWLSSSVSEQSPAAQQLQNELKAALEWPPPLSPVSEYSPAAQQLQWELKAALEWPPPLSPVTEYSPAAQQLQWELQQALENLPPPSPPRVPRFSPTEEQLLHETNQAHTALPPAPPSAPPESQTQGHSWREARLTQLGELPVLHPTIFSASSSAQQLSQEKVIPQKALPAPNPSAEQQGLRKTRKTRLGTPPLLLPNIPSDDAAARQLLQEQQQAQNAPPPQPSPEVIRESPLARHRLRQAHRLRTALSRQSAAINSQSQESDDSAFVQVASIFTNVGPSSHSSGAPQLFRGPSQVRALLEGSSTPSSRPRAHQDTQIQDQGESSTSQSSRATNSAFPEGRSSGGDTVSQDVIQQTAPPGILDGPQASNAVSTQVGQVETTAREWSLSVNREQPPRSRSAVPEMQPSTHLQPPSSTGNRSNSCPPTDARAPGSHNNQSPSGNEHLSARRSVSSTRPIKQEEYDPLYDDEPNAAPPSMPPRVKDPSQAQQESTGDSKTFRKRDRVDTRPPALSTQEYDPLYDDDEPNVAPPQLSPPPQPRVEESLQAQQNNAGDQTVAPPEQPPQAPPSPARDQSNDTSRDQRRSRRLRGQPPETGMLPLSPRKRRRR